MKQTFYELIAYLKSPILEKDPNTNITYRLRKFLYLLIISILTAIVLMPVFSLINELGLVNMDEHAMEKIMESLSKPVILLLVVVAAPFFEELLFRAPITLFKKAKAFKMAFYTFAIIFGLVHITNFNLTTNVLLLAPILIAPQIILGGYLGFIRVRFGLAWSMLLHACYNAFFMLITFASDLF